MKSLVASIIIFAANPYGLPEVNGSSGEITKVLQIVFAVAGALAVLMIIISGFRYIVSAGAPEAMTKAKNGILYSVAGLAVCILAETIVTFVVGKI